MKKACSAVKSGAAITQLLDQHCLLIGVVTQEMADKIRLNL